ncbi:MAG: biotin synthase BioB, partial [Peptostreptococcaceae bacterium]|nr:biotin synthase BioB [Peptostreptococcaceae bacterium]
MNINKLAEEIIEGRRLTRGEDLSFFANAELQELCHAGNHIREALCGNRIDLCSIINGRSGHCSENCKFCAQSAWNNTQIEEYTFLDCDTIAAD